MFAAEPIVNWDDTPEAYFMTSAEVDQWQRHVLSPTDAEKFVEEFRRKRGPQFQKDLAARIAFADKNFALAKVPGSRTARGRVFILLGPPNEQRADRGSGTGAGGVLGGSMQDNAMERGARAVFRWIYRSDRLPADLGRKELIIDFQTDVSRGTQHIENPGVVEPVLRKAATLLSEKYIAQASTAQAQAAPSSPAPATAAPAAAASSEAASTPDPLWQTTPAPNGAIYTAETFTSPTAKPLYTVNVFVPQGAGLGDTTSAQVVSLVRDANGRQVVSDRQTLDLSGYAGGRDRYVDRAYELTPGKYDAMVALYSADGSKLLSSWRESFEVPAAGTARASKLFVTSNVQQLEKQTATDPFTFVATKYAVRGDRTFKASDAISLFATIDNPAGSEPKLMQKMTFTKDGKPSFKTSLEPAQLTQTGPTSYLVGLNFPQDTFKPGHYTVELQLRDFNAPEGSDLRTKGYILKTEFDVK